MPSIEGARLPLLSRGTPSSVRLSLAPLRLDGSARPLCPRLDAGLASTPSQNCGGALATNNQSGPSFSSSESIKQKRHSRSQPPLQEPGRAKRHWRLRDAVGRGSLPPAPDKSETGPRLGTVTSIIRFAPHHNPFLDRRPATKRQLGQLRRRSNAAVQAVLTGGVQARHRASPAHRRRTARPTATETPVAATACRPPPPPSWLSTDGCLATKALTKASTAPPARAEAARLPRRDVAACLGNRHATATMPHRVTNFLRASSANSSHRKKKSTTTARTTTTMTTTTTTTTATASEAGAGAGSSVPPSSTSSGSSRTNSLAPSPYSSDSDDHQHHHHHHHHAVKMPDHFADALRNYNRLSLTFGRRSSREHANASSSSALTLDWSIESPPLVFYGPPDESTGALVSGQVVMDVKEETVNVGSLVASLSLNTTHKRPCQSHCPACQRHSASLKTWRLLAHATPTTLRKGRHLFPFSALLGGHLPASLETGLLSISYDFTAKAIVVCGDGTSCASVGLERCLHVRRSLPESLFPHHSIRVFPPTNIKADGHYDSVIHPTGPKTLTLRLSGLMAHDEEKAGMVYLWRLKKVSWTLQENVSTIAPACERHAPTARGVAKKKRVSNGLDDDDDDDDDDADDDSPERPKKGEPRAETRILGEKSLHEGWKSDYTGVDGTVDLELDYSINQSKSHSRLPKYSCDVRTRDGTEVTHSLAVELIVSKEYAPVGKTHLATQSGTGRILRMSFAVVLTECPGMGVSWDNEAPPVYQDVPPSPPGYPQHEGRRPPIDYDDLEPLDAQRASVGPAGVEPTIVEQPEPAGAELAEPALVEQPEPTGVEPAEPARRLELPLRPGPPPSHRAPRAGPAPRSD